MKKRSTLLLVTLIPLLLALPIGYGDPLETYQDRAAQYYEPGVNESALLNKDWNSAAEIRPGMFAPDFTVMDMDGLLYMLSAQRGERFVVLEIGNAT